MTAAPGGWTVSHTVHGHGNVNSGSGTQNNYISMVVRRGRQARFVAVEHIAWLARRFVRPLRLDEEVFERSSTIILTGPDGSGRRAAAVMLLTEFAALSASRLRELSDREDDSDEPVLDHEEIRPGELLLLDLTRSDDETVRSLQPELEGFRQAVNEKLARLVVVVRPDQRVLLAESFAGIILPIDRPPGEQVFRAHLREDGFELPETEPLPEAVRGHLAEAPLREIAELAELATEARRSKHGETTAEWLTTALKAQSDRGHRAAVLFREHQDAGMRALLVVSAFLRGAALDTMVEADREFCHIVGLPDADGHRLSGTYLAERMDSIALRTDGRHSVEFTELALDSAVRTHFWTYFPELRAAMSEWVTKTVDLAGIDRTLAAELVDRYVDLALVTGSVDYLQELIRRWATSTTDKQALAFQVLAAGLRDDNHAYRFRKYVYARSREHDLPVGFARLLIASCVRVIAPTRPTQALVRLHHFTRHHDESVRAEARERLSVLLRDRGFERWLLYRLARISPRDSDLEILLDLRLPPGMDQERSTRANLLTVWRRTLSGGVEALPAAALERWLDEHPLLLVDACDRQVQLLNQLYVFVRDRLFEVPDRAQRQRRRESARRLQRHIDAVLAGSHTKDLS